MTLPNCVIGCDISKPWLDCFAQPAGRHQRFANTPDGIAACVGLVRRQHGLCVLEATGPYDQALCQALHDADLPFHGANPRKARQFAQAAGFLAKTDRVDARMLAAYGQGVALRPEVMPSPDRQSLKTLVNRRDQLVEMAKIERTRQNQPHDRLLDDSLLAVLSLLEDQIGQLDHAIAAQIAASPVLAEHKRILCSAPGIGPVTASVLLAYLSELGQRDRRAISALAGLAPLAVDSGAMRGSRHIWGGRKRVRDALYMAALAATRSAPFKPIYQALRDKGKPAKLAIIAIARQLLVALNAAVRDKTPFKA